MERGAVIVTGAGRGIGLGIAQKLAGSGYDLALVDIQEQLIQEAVASLPGSGKHRGYVCDISEWDHTETVVREIQEAYGSVYGLVNNAGVTRDGLLVRMKPQDWQFVLDVNLTGTFHFTRAIAPLMMRQRQGRIVNIASVIGLTGNAGQANYAASKAGVIALTKSLAKELGSRSVTVNAVAPGFIKTAMTADLDEKVKAAMLGQIALKRFGETEDIAAVVFFLLSQDAAYITGQTIVCDGGMVP
jgi:3-oxoacyl-[acyl-carrier protein] reductase